MRKVAKLVEMTGFLSPELLRGETAVIPHQFHPEALAH
jgi:hypothetical protein